MPLVAALALAGCFVGAIACQQALGIDAEVRVQPRGNSVACGLPLKRGACQECLEERCCAQARECAQDSACAAYETCLNGCGADYACRARCIIDHPIGSVDAIPALDTCAVTSCEAPCGLSCGSVTSPSEPDAASDCQQCLAAHACSVSEACGRDVACQTIARCVQGCSTFDCQTACIDGRDASPEFLSLAFAGASTCYSACDIGHYWECVGHVTNPLAKAKSTFTATILDADSSKGLDGLTVKACEPGDTACASPLATGTSDANGVVTLALDLAPTPYGFHGYFEISSTSPTFVPYLYFLSFPLSEPKAAATLVLLSQSSFQNLVSLVNVPIDKDRGTVAVVVTDCLLTGAPDVVVAADGIDGATQERYLDGSFLSNTATATDRSGLVMFLNAPLGLVSVRATPRSIGRVSSRTSVFVKPGTISLVQANPSP